MRGLFIKDLEILKGNLRTYLLVAGLAAVYLFSGIKGITFFLPYVSFVLSMMVLNTVSYDDYDNGMAYLMTLPVKRDTYVKEKYSLGILIAGAGWAISSVVAVACQELFYKNSWRELLPQMAVSLFMGFAVMAVTLPVQLKFTNEKSQTIKIGIMMAMWLGVLGVVKLLELLNIDVDAALENLSHMGELGLALILAAFLAGLLAVSYAVSLHVVRREEY